MLPRPLLCGLASTVALAGCGSGDGADRPSAERKLLERSAMAMESKRTFAGALRVQTSGTDGIGLSGRIVSLTDASRLRIRGSASVGANPGPFEERVFGDKQYFRGEVFAAALPAGKRWLRRTDPTPTPQRPAADALRFLAEEGDLRRVGAETIDGRATTHLSGSFDLGKFAGRMPGNIAGDEDAGGLTTTIDLWIADDDALVTRLRLRLVRGGTVGALDTTIDVERYDVPLGFRPPPAAVTHAG